MSDAPVMKILYGPPGTGKTYRAAREAVRAVTGSEPKTNASAMTQFKALLEQKRIWWVTFHPSYTYEDFVEGFRPKLTVNNELVYEVEPGPFKLACGGVKAGAAHLRHDIAPGESLVSTGKSTFDVVRVDENSVTVKSQVTRKDKVAASKEEVITIDLLEKLRKADVRPDELSFSGKQHAQRKEVAKRAGVPVTTFTVTGPIRAVYKRYLDWTPPATPAKSGGPVAFVIDEINRADLSRVFGELITLLEPDKREGAREERKVFLPYSKTSFTVPASLSVIGTMNTADRSLALMDFALRRRFEFQEVEPNPALCSKNYGGVDVGALLAAWNDRITVLRSRDHRFGHAELMTEKLESVRMAQPGWGTDSNGQLRALAHTLRAKFIPTLLEYFHDDWRKCRTVLGPAELELMKERQPADGGGYYDADVSDASGFELTEWWDPASSKWDPDSFRAALTRSLPK